MVSRYNGDVLAPGWQRANRPTSRPITVEPGLVVEDAATGYCGAILRCQNGLVVLEDRHGKLRSFPLGTGFLLEGRPVELKAPPTTARRDAKYTAAGSLNTLVTAPQVAKVSRLWVEGIHDAELIEKVWGDDLRHIGVVVEPLGGIDRLAERVAEFAPAGDSRLGVLVDHLLPGTKESNLAAQVTAGPYRGHVLILGHRYIDIWQAVSPTALGIARWPEVPRGQDWKTGVCQGLGWAYRRPEDLAQAWRRILARVHSWRDLDRAFTTNVERLIDFVQEADPESIPG